MKKRSFWLTFLGGLILFLGIGLAHAYQPPLRPTFNGKTAIAPSSQLLASHPASKGTQAPKPTTRSSEPPDEESHPPDREPEGSSGEPEPSGLRPFKEITKSMLRSQGLFTVYRDQDKGKLYAEIKPEQLNKNFLCAITLESGIGESGLYSGLPLKDFMFQFRRVNNNLHFVVPNVSFRTTPGDPAQRSINRSFSDSVLYSLPIKSIHPDRKTLLIDLGPLMLGDLPGLTSMMSWMVETPYVLDASKSYFGPAKAFPLNLEIESVYGFSSPSDEADLPTLPDTRALSLRVHYSLSTLPEKNGYRPRFADDRVGYFFTPYQNFSNDSRRDRFVRYIYRWNLEKQDPKAPLSPPKQPIVFWIDNAVPVEYRQPMREGALMWNHAFEQAGFKDAIEVRQMPDDAKWDPADVRYNTIRWFNSLDGFFAAGFPRVNPLTGEILDTDIIVDSNYIDALKWKYRALGEPNESEKKSFFSSLIANQKLCPHGGMHLRGLQKQNRPAKDEKQEQARAAFSQLTEDHDLCYGMESVQEATVGMLSLSMIQNAMPSSSEVKEFTQQFLRELIAHEVGHTLGLRHNFHGSTLLSPQELNNPQITRSKGLVSSVMDYNPPNLAPKGVKQGDYFTHKVGPYDEWAIEYGYKPSGAANPTAELRFLEQIAQRSSEPALAYAPDEDTIDFLDPGVNRFDMSNDVLLYAQWQMDNARELWSRLDKRYPIPGESYSEVSWIFDTIFINYFRYAYFTTKYVGGQSFSRSHAEGSSRKNLPFQSVPLAKQHAALATLQKYVFDETAFQFSPELLNKLAPSRWYHWGNRVPIARLDYPIHDRIFLLQSLLLEELLSGDRLVRMQDTELKTRAGESLTLPDLFETLQTSIWKEVTQANDKPAISSLRRALQREHMNLLTAMVLRNTDVPEDARTLAWYQLRQLQNQLGKVLGRRGGDLDTYTKAHLEESRDRINKALNAQLQSQ